MQAPEASAVVSEGGAIAAEEDTACGSGPGDAASDKGAKYRSSAVFVEPDDPRDLEQDVTWMDMAREQAENDPRTRETLVQLLEIAGRGAKAIKGVDAELADLIKVGLPLLDGVLDDTHAVAIEFCPDTQLVEIRQCKRS